MLSKKQLIKKVLAIFSPSENAYSETFIQAHRRLAFDVKYYYGGYLPYKLDGQEQLVKFSIAERIKKKLDTRFNLYEHALLNSLKREKIDIVLAEYGPTAAKSLKVIAAVGLPLVVHFHGYDASIDSIKKEYTKAYNAVFSYACCIVAVSNKMKQSLIGLGCPADKIVVSVYGPDAAYLQLRPSYSLKQFIGVGRLVEKKGHEYTIRAFKKVVNIYPAARLLLVGDGILSSSLKALSKELGLQNNIEFTGIKTGPELLEFYQQSTAFVQHSVTARDGDEEGTPVAILEAQAARLPVISTYHAGIPDVVIHNETGLLVTEKDIEGMAEAMIRILAEEGLAATMGKAATQRIAQHFLMEKNLAELTGIIEQCIVTSSHPEKQ